MVEQYMSLLGRHIHYPLNFKYLLYIHAKTRRCVNIAYKMKFEAEIWNNSNKLDDAQHCIPKSQETYWKTE